MNRKNKKNKILLLSFLGIVLVFVACFIIYDSYQIKDPKHYFDLGIKASYTRDIPEEIKNFKKAIYYCHKDLPKHRSLAISSYDGLATAYMHKEAYDKEEETLLKGLEFSEKYYGKDSPVAFRLYYMLSCNASYDKKYVKSAKYNRKILEIKERISPAKIKDNSDFKTYVILAYRGIAGSYMYEKKYDSAIKILLKGVDVSVAYFGKNTPETNGVYCDLALYTHYYEGDKKAAKYFQTILKIEKDIPPEKTRDLAEICNQISKLYLQTKNEIKAEEYKKKHIQYILEKRQNKNHMEKYY
jgi:tetratricopeptide (TPR) repeat protein